MRASPVPLRPAAPSENAHGSADFGRAYTICVEKARRNIERLADRPMSAAWAVDGSYFGFHEGFFDIGNWTSSFFTGMALRAFESTRDFYFLKQVNRLADVYRDKVTHYRMDTMHDLGFLYSLYSVALHRLTGDLHHRRTALRATDELARRFSAKGNYIQAWGRMDQTTSDYAGLAIIDSLMNLPLLFWAARETGNVFYHEIAVKHADTTHAHFLRPDDSVYHAFRFELASGRPLAADNYCGRSVDSHWARGTAWAIYGFVLAYRHTQDAKYLDAATRLARRFAALLDDELVPVWDFTLPRDAHRLRDASAAAIAVCGFDELTSHRADTALAAVADKLLHRLCSADYFDHDLNCPGVVRHAQVGDGIGKAKNVYTSWGDYFLMEALAHRLHGTNGYW